MGGDLVFMFFLLDRRRMGRRTMFSNKIRGGSMTISDWCSWV